MVRGRARHDGVQLAGHRMAAPTPHGGPSACTDHGRESLSRACCLAHGFPLASFNVKDFQDFAAHEGLDLITP